MNEITNLLRDVRTLGLDRSFNNILNDTSLRHSTYPPYNIYSVNTGDDSAERNSQDEYYVIEVGVAGFEKEDIDITVMDHQLYINGSLSHSEGDDSTVYHHRGLAFRDFRLKFALHEFAEIRDAKIENGVLRIVVGMLVPEERKPKRIEIL